MNSLASVTGVLIGAALVIAVGAMIWSLPVYLLWNYCLVPAIPSIQEITWLQSLGIYILTSLLFKTTISKSD